MFILTTFSDLITIPPALFRVRTRSALEDLINAKYANKVVPNTGLCIALYDILKSGDGVVYKGSANVNVTFRMIVFRPFKGEILTGRISSSTQHGIKVRLGGFFDDVFIPGDNMFEGTKFDHLEQIWVWNNDGEAYYMDKNEEIRFRIETEFFRDQNPRAPLKAGETDVESEQNRAPSYHILGSCNQSGLGLVSWW
ncbi:DNA-directed RNA polymerase III 25 kDa polypeptide [Ascobolus immersus RN42]|uniref:DNA-directed RNA polymerase subunit n=1 Tax=Ascobolus immersus RN42 TaxID=1160509 RepID=A0A3N4I572_ASCIM|nr:DNA-directed RNA polymerase III 25 kDa polypeptide [Ascobolus immersus RN42]